MPQAVIVKYCRLDTELTAAMEDAAAKKAKLVPILVCSVCNPRNHNRGHLNIDTTWKVLVEKKFLCLGHFRQHVSGNRVEFGMSEKSEVNNLAVMPLLVPAQHIVGLYFPKGKSHPDF